MRIQHGKPVFWMPVLPLLMLLFGVLLAAESPGTLWPMEAGRAWIYIDQNGKAVETKITDVIERKSNVGDKSRTIRIYILVTSVDGAPTREEHYVVDEGTVSRSYSMQLIDGVVTRFEPPVELIRPGISPGDSWQHVGAAIVSRRGVDGTTVYSVRVYSQAVAGGTRKVGEVDAECISIKTDISFEDEDGAEVLSGETLTQYVMGVGPWRISQGNGLPAVSLVLRSYGDKPAGGV